MRILLIDVRTKKAEILSMKSQEGQDPVVDLLRGVAQQGVLRAGGNSSLGYLDNHPQSLMEHTHQEYTPSIEH